ncbi:MAG TPA: hypothetical protein VFX76_05990, partial [Roseiflexaceae bacterium]|nr:hypothetical protein [Roseiflexaceae bacterium]
MAVSASSVCAAPLTVNCIDAILTGKALERMTKLLGDLWLPHHILARSVPIGIHTADAAACCSAWAALNWRH